ncbi:ribosomal protein S24e family protein isoform X1 [Wolffia australiana]
MAISKLGLLRNSVRAIFNSGSGGIFPVRCLSTAASGDPAESLTDSIVDPPEGPCFARIRNIGRSTLKTDIIHHFEGSGLTEDDLKIEYNRNFDPTGILAQFPSRSSYNAAGRQNTKKGQPYAMMPIDRKLWDLQTSYYGKTVRVKVPRNAIAEDIERIFHGCNYDGSATEIFLRPGPEPKEPIKMALVRFPTREEAMTAARLRNRSFCLNSHVIMHVLQ